MNVTVCPINPPGHDWQNGLSCLWCKATRTPHDAIVSGLASRRGGTEDAAHALLAAYRAETVAERDAEIVRWLVKKAREFHARSRKQERAQGDTCASLASQIARGAVRPNNMDMLPNAGFFEVDRTYTSDTWTFRCEAVSPSPGTGERRALGWMYKPAHGVHGWYPTALDPDDWEHGGWTDVTEGGEGR